MRLVPFVLFTALLVAQQPSGPVFRAGTKLVEVSVTVLDKKGNAVTGLDTADFTILDEGKPRPVAFFRFDGVPPASAARPASTTPALPPGVFSNRPELAGEAPRNVTALVLDSLNTPPTQMTVARAQMMRYLRALEPQTRVAIFLMGAKLRILHDFTDDPAALRARLDKVTLGMPSVNITDYNQSIVEAEAFVDMFAGDPAMQAAAEEMARNVLDFEAMANAAARRNRLEQSLAVMEALGSHLAGIPGRKNLVWIGAGFSMFTITGNMGMGPHGSVENFETKVRQTSQRLAQQGIILYIVDSKGIAIPTDQTAASRMPLPPRGRGRFEPQMDSAAISDDPHPAMELMANITGGRYLFNNNDLSAGFKQAALDLQGSYTLGFYMPDDPDDKWHKLKVRVKRSGVNVRHREGYLANLPPAQPTEWTSEKWRAVFADPIGSTAIPLTAKCERTPTGELDLTLLTDVAALQFHPDGDNFKADLEIGVSDRTIDGATTSRRAGFTATVSTANWEEARKRGIAYRKQWKPAAGTATLRVVVHDVRTGNYGTLEVPLSH
jgi:VWFA-related protein